MLCEGGGGKVFLGKHESGKGYCPEGGGKGGGVRHEKDLKLDGNNNGMMRRIGVWKHLLLRLFDRKGITRNERGLNEGVKTWPS